MGTLYWAFNRDTLRAMELGKWHDAAKQELLPTATTKELVRAAMPQAGDEDAPHPWPEFYDRVAECLERVGLPVEIKSEHYEGALSPEIIVTETVYTQGHTYVGDRLTNHIGDDADYWHMG